MKIFLMYQSACWFSERLENRTEGTRWRKTWNNVELTIKQWCWSLNPSRWCSPFLWGPNFYNYTPFHFHNENSTSIGRLWKIERRKYFLGNLGPFPVGYLIGSYWIFLMAPIYPKLQAAVGTNARPPTGTHTKSSKNILPHTPILTTENLFGYIPINLANTYRKTALHPCKQRESSGQLIFQQNLMPHRSKSYSNFPARQFV